MVPCVIIVLMNLYCFLPTPPNNEKDHLFVMCSLALGNGLCCCYILRIGIHGLSRLNSQFVEQPGKEPGSVGKGKTRCNWRLVLRSPVFFNFASGSYDNMNQDHTGEWVDPLS